MPQNIHTVGVVTRKIIAMDAGKSFGEIGIVPHSPGEVFVFIIYARIHNSYDGSTFFGF